MAAIPNGGDPTLNYLNRLIHLLGQPTEKMQAAGMEVIVENAEVSYVSITAPRTIFKAMVKIALEEAENG